MAHVPEEVRQYVCVSCQITHAGTPIHQTASEHTFEPSSACGGCGETEFVTMGDWVHHHADT